MNKNNLAAALMLFLLAANLTAQDVPGSQEPSGQEPQNAPVLLSPADVSQLVAPIALYPDALIALIMPASTVPSDIVLADRYITAGGDPNQVSNQSWDQSVKSLAHYPDVLAWMDQNLDWTTSLGEAFINQPVDVMNAIQSLRAQAQYAGNLVDTPQQNVIVQNDIISIVPTDPEVIYVPQYDPVVVYSQPYSPDEGAYISFGTGCAVGAWLCYDFDWNNRCFYQGKWSGWQGNHGGNTTTVNVTTISNISNTSATVWHPSPSSAHQIAQRQHHNGGNARIVHAGSSGVAGNSQDENPQRINSGGGVAYNPKQGSPLVPRPTRIRVTGAGVPTKPVISETPIMNSGITPQKHAPISSTGGSLTPVYAPAAPPQLAMPENSKSTQGMTHETHAPYTLPTTAAPDSAPAPGSFNSKIQPVTQHPYSVSQSFPSQNQGQKIIPHPSSAPSEPVYAPSVHQEHLGSQVIHEPKRTLEAAPAPVAPVRNEPQEVPHEQHNIVPVQQAPPHVQQHHEEPAPVNVAPQQPVAAPQASESKEERRSDKKKDKDAH